MATLNTLSNLITNAKQTPSGKIEWTDDSLKGIQDEVKYLFTQNGAQVTENTGTLSVLDNESSQIAIVTEDATVANNGVYFWNLTPVSAIFFPAASNGYWNILEFGVLTTVGQGYIPYSNLGNLDESYLKQTTNEIKMEGGSFVANNSTSAGPYFQCGDTDSIGNDVIFTVDDKIQTISSKKGAANLGIRLDLNGNIYLIGNLDARKQLSIDGNNSVYALGDAIASKGLRIDTVAPTYKLGNYASNIGLILTDTTGYLGTSTWGYNYTGTTIVAGNTSINLTLNDTANTATLGDGTKGLLVDVTNNGYILGNGTNGLNINTTGTYTLGNGTDGLSMNTTTDDYTLGTPDYGLKVDYSIPLAAYVSLGSLSTGDGLFITNSAAGDVYTLASSTAGKGLFIDLSADTYKLGTFAGYGLSLTATTGRLGSATFGYNYTATTIVAGNSSISLTLDDTANTGSVGTSAKGLSVNMNSNLYKLGEYSTKGLFIDTNNQTYQLGFAANNLELNINATSQLFKLGNTSTGAGLQVDLTNNSYYLGSGVKALVINTTANTYVLGSDTEGLYINTGANDYQLGNYVLNTGLIIGSTDGYLGYNANYGSFNYNFTSSLLTVGSSSSISLQVDNTASTVKTTGGPQTNGILIDVPNDLYLLGNDLESPSAKFFGVRGTNTANPSLYMTQDFLDPAGGSNPAEKILVNIPGVGPRWIQLYQ